MKLTTTTNFDMVDVNNKNLKIQLQRYKTIISIYFTPKNQLWCILKDGKKKCILKKIIDNVWLRNFLKSQKIITYKDSKLIKKKANVGFIDKDLRNTRCNFSSIGTKTQYFRHITKYSKKNFTFIDLFSGMGSFHYVLKKFGGKCVLAVDNDTNCNKIYYKNFGVNSKGDLLNLNINDIPSHDILCGGFPCQPFSVAGLQKGLSDDRSNVIWKIFEIVKKKRPRFVILENVKGLLNHDSGKTFSIICNNLKTELYFVKFKILNTKVITKLPQNRERLFVLAFKNYIDYCNFDFNFNAKNSYELKFFLESNVPKKYYYTKNSKIYDILKKTVVKSIDSGTVYQYRRGVVRENKSQVCPTLTAHMGTGGHNVPIILDSVGIRKLTPKECLNLQGFLKYNINGFSDSCLYKLCGNSVTIDVLNLIVLNLLKNVKKDLI